MEGKAKYRPSKTQLNLGELRELVEAFKRENRKLKAELGDAEYGLKWTRDKLQEVEEENRKLKLIILRMTEEGEKSANSTNTDRPHHKGY